MLKQVREPQFVSSAYFLKFRFEKGHYALAGREKIGDVQALKIEYYPEAGPVQGRPQQAGQEGQGRRRSHRREDEQVVDGHAVDRSRVASDPAVHLRRHRLGLLPGPLARAHRRRRSDDADGAGLSECLAAEEHRDAFRDDARGRRRRCLIPRRVRRTTKKPPSPTRSSNARAADRPVLRVRGGRADLARCGRRSARPRQPHHARCRRARHCRRGRRQARHRRADRRDHATSSKRAAASTASRSASASDRSTTPTTSC